MNDGAGAISEDPRGTHWSSKKSRKRMKKSSSEIFFFFAVVKGNKSCLRVSDNWKSNYSSLEVLSHSS